METLLPNLALDYSSTSVEWTANSVVRGAIHVADQATLRDTTTSYDQQPTWVYVVLPQSSNILYHQSGGEF